MFRHVLSWWNPEKKTSGEHTVTYPTAEAAEQARKKMTGRPGGRTYGHMPRRVK